MCVCSWLKYRFRNAFQLLIIAMIVVVVLFLVVRIATALGICLASGPFLSPSISGLVLMVKVDG